MSQLVEELRRDHVAMVDMLNKVKDLGIASKEAQATLLAAKTNLLAHLKKEDLHLYPRMQKAAESNSSVRMVLDSFTKEMGELSKFALQFFDNYSQGGSGIEFAKDFGRLFATLRTRLQREESILYKEYDKLAS
ncbi:MAG: hemerythrin domain-containing protein [Thermodesulfovibrionales bacterium]